MSVITIYGRPKVGKTTLALKDAPKNATCVISADRGLIGIDTTGFTVVEDTSSRNLNKTVLSAASLKKHKRFVIDTGTALYANMLSEIAQGGTPSLNQRGVANNGFATLLRTLRDSEKEVIVLCQERMVMPTEDWAPEDEDEDQTASVTPDLPQGPHSVLMQMSDAIGRLYVANIDDKRLRRLWLTATPGIVAGARSKTYKGTPPYLKTPTIGRLNQFLGWTR